MTLTPADREAIETFMEAVRAGTNSAADLEDFEAVLSRLLAAHDAMEKAVVASVAALKERPVAGATILDQAQALPGAIHNALSQMGQMLDGLQDIAVAGMNAAMAPVLADEAKDAMQAELAARSEIITDLVGNNVELKEANTSLRCSYGRYVTQAAARVQELEAQVRQLESEHCYPDGMRHVNA
jgi:small-conductance mechanosensitive channel